MDFRNLFPSKYLTAADLEGAERVLTIRTITPVEEVGQSKDKRPVAYFDGTTKGMVLNKTNAKRIAKLYGNDVSAWVGRQITIYPSECDFGDDVVPCIRVKPEAPAVAQPQQTAQPQQAMTPEMLAQFQQFMAMQQKPT